MYPLLVRAVGVFASIIGVLAALKDRIVKNLDPMQPINVGFYVSAGLATVLFGIAAFFYLKDGVTVPNGNRRPEVSVDSVLYLHVCRNCTGDELSGKLTEYFTSTEKKPVTEIAWNSKTGPATMILSGFSYGLESSVRSVVAISATLMVALFSFQGNPLLAAYGMCAFRVSAFSQQRVTFWRWIPLARSRITPTGSSRCPACWRRIRNTARE